MLLVITFPGMDLIDVVLPDVYHDVKAEVVYRIFCMKTMMFIWYYTSNFAWSALLQSSTFPVSLEFLYLHIIIVKWLARKSDLFKTELYINVYYRQLNISYIYILCIMNMYHNMWISYFTDRTAAYSWERNSWLWVMIAHDNTLNTFGELYCMR